MNTLLKSFSARALAAVAAFAVVTAQAHEFRIANIKIAHPYARSTAPGQTNGGAFLSLENAGADDRLLSVDATEVASSAELHQMAMEGDVMRMRQLDAIDVPTGKPVSLRPGSLHVMLLGLKAPLKEGGKFAMKLRFEKAGEVTVTVHVEKPGADHSEAHKHR